MTSSKNLFKMAKKWQNLATIRKKRAYSLPRFSDSYYKTCLVADKGHFVVYTADYKRLMIPLLCLESEIFMELLKLSEDEFGLPCGGPITLPCDAVFVEFVISLINQGGEYRDLEKALILSVVTSNCSSLEVSLNQQIVECRY